MISKLLDSLSEYLAHRKGSAPHYWHGSDRDQSHHPIRFSAQPACL
jgi:hypothetical protein